MKPVRASQRVIPERREEASNSSLRRSLAVAILRSALFMVGLKLEQRPIFFVIKLQAVGLKSNNALILKITFKNLIKGLKFDSSGKIIYCPTKMSALLPST